jgi:hypothetical protein
LSEATSLDRVSNLSSWATMRFCRSVVEARISFSICLASSVVKGVDMVAGWGGWWCKVGRVGGMITGARKPGSGYQVVANQGLYSSTMRELQR